MGRASASVRIPRTSGLLIGQIDTLICTLAPHSNYSILRLSERSGSSHTKYFKNGSGPCLHGTQDEGGTTKHNWLARCQYNVTGWVSMWAYDMLSQ